MNTLPCGSGDSRLIRSGTQTTSLHKWKVVKDFSTRLTVLRRLGVKCRIETTWVEIKCSVPPKSAIESTQTQLEVNKPSEHTSTKSRIGKGETRKAWNICKELALDPMVFYPLLLALISIQARKDSPGEISITELVAIAVIVWEVTPIAARKQILLLCSFCLMISGVDAEDPTENCKPEDSNASERHGYAETAVVTLLISILTIGVARRMYNRWHPLQAVPVGPAVPVAPAVPAVPVPEFDVMRGLDRSSIPTRGDPTFDIAPKID